MVEKSIALAMFSFKIIVDTYTGLVHEQGFSPCLLEPIQPEPRSSPKQQNLVT